MNTIVGTVDNVSVFSHVALEVQFNGLELLAENAESQETISEL